MNIDAREAALGLLSMGHGQSAGGGYGQGSRAGGGGGSSVGDVDMGYERDEREHGRGRERGSGSGFGVASTSTSGSGSGISSNASLSSRTTPTPVAATSSATLNSILTTTVSTPVIPSKRKAELVGDTENREFRPSPGAPFSHHQQRLSSPPPISISNSKLHSTHSQTTSLHDYGNNPSTSNATTDLSTEPIDCMCGSSFDDGFSIACDRCGRWCHYVCFGIRQGNVPEDFLCWVCLPRPEELRRRASLIQMQQREASKSFAALGVGERGGHFPGVMDGFNGGFALGDGGQEGMGGADDLATHNGRRGGRRQTSPGNERRRRSGGVNAESMLPVVHTGGGKRKRRPSVVHPTHPSLSSMPPPPSTFTSTSTSTSTTTPGASTSAAPHANGAPGPGEGGEENHEVDDSWAQTYVHIHEDIIASEETRQRLRKQAQDWRGVTAVAIDPSSSSPSSSTPNPDAAPIKIKQLPPQTAYNPHLLPTSNPDILPPTYTVHTTQPIPTEHLITPYTSLITPSSQYLADPLNAYAHLGMPKPYVHLVGRPLAVALDARGVGGKGRFVRSGCRPNAVIRPVLCSKKSKSKGKEKEKDNGVVWEGDGPGPGRQRKGDQEEREEEEEERMLSFGVFALRDLKADEEVVLGWEWDDGNVVHRLPALLSAPRMFPPRFPSSTSPSQPNGYSHPHPQFNHHHNAYIPDPKTSPHELQNLRRQMNNILHALSSTFTTCACGARAKDCALTQMARFVDGQEEGVKKSAGGSPGYDNGQQQQADLGPLIGRKRGFLTKERIPGSGGIGGMILVDEEEEARVKASASSRAGGVNGHSVKTPTPRTAGAAATGGSTSNTPTGDPPLAPNILFPTSPTLGKGKSALSPGALKSVGVGGTRGKRGKGGRGRGRGRGGRAAVGGGGGGDEGGEDGHGQGAGEEGESVDDEDGGVRRIQTRSSALLALSNNKPISKSPLVQSTTSSSLDEPTTPPPPPPPQAARGQSSDLDMEMMYSGVSPPPDEEKMPPKMRKKWMHRELVALKEVVGGSSGKVGLGISGVDTSPTTSRPTPSTSACESSSSSTMPPPPIPSRSSQSSPSPMTMSPSSTFQLPHQQPQPQQLLTPAHTPSLPPPGPPPFSSSSTSSTPTPTGTPAPPPATTISASSVHGHLQAQGPATASPSPLVGFENLSLLSPAIPGPVLEYQHQLQHQPHPRERTVPPPKTPPPIHLRHDAHLREQEEPRRREEDDNEDDAESPTPTPTHAHPQPQTETGWSPLKRLSAVAALVPNLSPRPVPASSRVKKGEDSDVEMDTDGQDHDVVDDDGRRSSSPVSSGMNGGGRSSRSRSGSVSSSVQTLKPVHRDTELRKERDDDDVDMQSAPASPAPAPVHRTPIPKSPIIDSSSLPSTLAALDLFSSNEGLANPPTPRGSTPPSPSAESVEVESGDKDQAEEVGDEEVGDDVQMDISPTSVVDRTQAITKVEEASEEVEEEAVVKDLQASEEPAAEKSPVAPPPTSVSPSSEIAQAERKEVVPPAPEPIPAATSASASSTASSEPQPQPAEQPAQPEQPSEPALASAPAPTQAPAKVKLSLKDFAARRRKMKEDMAQGGMGSPGGPLSAGGLPSSAGAGSTNGLGGTGLVGSAGMGGGFGLGLGLVGGMGAGAGTGRLSPMVGGAGVGVAGGAVEEEGKEKGSEQEKDNGMKMDMEVKEAKDGVKNVDDGQQHPQQQSPLKAPSTTSISPTASTPVMDVRVIEDDKSARKNLSTKSPTPIRYPPSPPPQRLTSSLSRFDAQAFSAAASAIVNGQHKPPPIPALPPSSPMAAMSSPQLLPSSPPLHGMDLDRDEDEGEGEMRDREEERKNEEERRIEKERMEEAKRAELDKEEEMKVDKQQSELVVVETRQAKLEMIEPVVPPARATVTPTPTPMPKAKQQPPPPPQLLSRIDTSPHPNVFGVNAHIRRASREDGEIELEVGEVRPSSPVVPSHTPITPQSRFHPPSKVSAAPSLSPTPQAVNPIPLARRLHPPANNNSIGRLHRYEPSPPPRSATSASTPTAISKPKTPPPPVRANNMWSSPQPPLKTPVVATPGVSVAGPSSLSSNGTGLHPRSPPRGPRSLWNGAASSAGTSTLANTNPSAATPTATVTSNGTPLFPENPTGPPTAPRALRQFMKERGQMPGPHPPHHHPHAPHQLHTSPGMAANGPSRFYSPGDRDRDRDDERDRARAGDRERDRGRPGMSFRDRLSLESRLSTAANNNNVNNGSLSRDRSRSSRSRSRSRSRSPVSRDREHYIRDRDRRWDSRGGGRFGRPPVSPYSASSPVAGHVKRGGWRV